MKFEIDPNTFEPIYYEVAELICLSCMERWIGVYRQDTLLKDLKCKCGAKGFIIKTGQTIEEADKEAKHE